METKTFDIGDVLSITTGRLLSPEGIDGIYKILDWMTGDRNFTHQLPRVSRECEPWLRRWFPELADITGDDVTPENFKDWLAALKKKHGNTRAVARIPKDDHEAKNPIAEAVEMFGADRVVVVKP